MLKTLLPTTLCALLAVGCTPEGRSSGGGGGGGGATTDAGPAVDSGPQTCDMSGGRAATCPADAEWVVSVSGKVQTETGAGIGGAFAQVCLRQAPGNLLLCLRPDDADMNGDFSVEIPDNTRCLSEITMRSLQVDVNRASMYCHLKLNHCETAVTLPTPVTLYPTTPAPNLPAEGDRNITRTVTFADGLEMEVKPFDFFSDYAQLAAAKVTERNLCFLEGQPAPDLLYAFSPEGAISGTGFAARIPNSEGWAAGTMADIWVLGGLGCMTPTGEEITEAGWEKIAVGTVNASGTHIETTATAGITCLTWMGVTKR